MNLPIRWAVVRELSTKQPAIMAKLTHGGKLYEKTFVIQPQTTPALLHLVIAAMTAEIVNAVNAT